MISVSAVGTRDSPPSGRRYASGSGGAPPGLCIRAALSVREAELVPGRFRDETLVRLARSDLPESRQQLAFNYKLAFERHSRHSVHLDRDRAAQLKALLEQHFPGI